MDRKTWMKINTRSLHGKTVAVTGATGGLGRELCRYILQLGGKLILLTRDEEKSLSLTNALLEEFPGSTVSRIPAELSNPASVTAMCRSLKAQPLDILCLNAGTYCMPRRPGKSGYDIVFETNFLSQYCIARQLLPLLESRHGKILVTGSIAHLGVVTNPRDPDFKLESNQEKIYGNSKRWLMFSLMELCREHPQVSFAIGHPGITFTGITRNYPESRKKVLKYAMPLTFPSPEHAARGLCQALTQEIPYLHWIGPKIKNIWGDPGIFPLTSCPKEERTRIYADAQTMYRQLISESAAESTAENGPAGSPSAAEGRCD